MNPRGRIFKFFLVFHGILLWFATLRPSFLISGPVTNLRFSLIRHDFLTAIWDDDPGGDSYQVVLSTVTGFAINISSGPTEVNQNTTNYYGLQPNTTFAFKV